jgi:hypothetical protein
MTTLALNYHIEGEIRWNLIKGKTTTVKDDFGKFQGFQANSYLIRPYANIESGDVLLSYGEYEVCLEEHRWKSAKGGICPGGKNHKRNDSWSRIDLWKFADTSITEWVRTICENIARNPLHSHYEDVMKQIVVGEVIAHPAEARVHLMEQIIHEEARLAEGARLYQIQPSINVLNEHFPKNFSSCEYPYRCNFTTICHSNDNVEELLVTSPRAGMGMEFKERTPNHNENVGEEE